ncbi:Hint domain-containing protein [Pacificibacter maritimus]|uniref:Hint domain-containing protein n=1 Tax=Pacificibacter maritimus TaxID=762213 RepID=A0A3N4U8Y1_9RHOB|nr:Hint domain-containing protein [Pacificibacter maritimus]RPE67196.1 Hint domain-containing protein [Pacificibacter maritimus]
MHSSFGTFEQPDTGDTLALWDADSESPTAQLPSTPAGLTGCGPNVMIETAEGPQPAEWLRSGDLVLTRDNGYQPVVWVGRSSLNDPGALPPLRVNSGALGHNTPAHDLVVSPNHKILLNSPLVDLYFGNDEVLAPASDIATEDEINFEAPESNYAYCHILFAQHEVILSEGIWIESLFPNEETLNFLGPDIAHIIAERLGPDFATSKTARMCLHKGEAVVLKPRQAVAARRTIAA